MIDKTVATFDEAVTDVPHGAMIHVGGFIGSGLCPSYLITALARKAPERLTIVCTHMGGGLRRNREFANAAQGMMRIPPDYFDVGLLSELHLVAKGITTFPVSTRGSESPFERLLIDGEAEVELIGQGSLSERIRCARAGIAAFYTPVGVGTLVAENKEVRDFNGTPHLLETALFADFAIIRAHQADRYGNLVYKGTPSFSASMAGAARTTIAEVDEIVPLGELNPQHIITPGVYVQRVVKRPAVPVSSWEQPC